MTGKFACPDSGSLERLLLGDMPDLEIQILEGHVLGCPNCLGVIRGLKKEDALVDVVRAGGKIGAIPREEIDEDLIARLCELRRQPSDTLPPSPERPEEARRLQEAGLIKKSEGGRFPREAGLLTLTSIGFSVETPAAERVLSTRNADELSNLFAPPVEPDEMGRIGAYGILRVLGTGATAIVLAARQEKPRRLVALKMILTGPPGKTRLARFRGESELLARLRHPNIVHVHEVGVHAGRPYFTMEYRAGGSLAQRLAALPFPPKEAARLLEILGRAVHAAHEQGIVHRDLKPSNVLLAADGTPSIGDFGLAKQLEGEFGSATPADRTETGAILGTPGYMAPEQAASRVREIGPRADVYALGAILYECLTGRPPFKAATVLETLEQTRSQEPVPPGRLQPSLPRDLQTICLKCLEKEPRRRYATAMAMADDLGRFLEGKPIVARPVRPWERVWKWARRKPALAALLALSLLGVLGIAIGLAAHNHQLATSLAETKAQRERADHNYHAARASIRQMLARLNVQREADVPHSQELRRKLLEDSLDFYEAVLLRADNRDPGVRMDAAFALQETVAIQTALGPPDATRKHLRRAIGLLEDAERIMGPAEAAKTRQHTSPMLAEWYANLGRLAHAAGRLEERDHAYGRALALRERGVEDSPDSPMAQCALADVLVELGEIDRDASRWTDAETSYTRALAIGARLIAGHPGDDDLRIQQAAVCVRLGWFYRVRHRPDEAGPLFARANNLLTALAQAHPDQARCAVSLANACNCWAVILTETGQPEAAREQANRAVDLMEALNRRMPGSDQGHLRNAHWRRALAYEALGRWPDAVNDWDRVVALGSAPPGPRLRAEALARAGEHTRAFSEFQHLAQNPDLTVEDIWSLARVCCESATAAWFNAKLSPRDRTDRTERYASQAVALLQKLRNRGDFQVSGNAQRLREDADLNPLRGRADFRRLVKDVGPEKPK